ncbi:hypothetical protein MKX03_015542 [Papaver bracteatum]|nr:hypothetical protein MKX03_015542 [Papaver bracteatum]
MGSKNVKVFIWLALVVALLLMSYQVLTVEVTENNGVESLKYDASLAVAGGAQCGSRGCCRFRSVSTCLRCCSN